MSSSNDNFKDVPRFAAGVLEQASSKNKPSKQPEDHSWIWANCTRGSPELQEKFPLLARLQIPLGSTPTDAKCRNSILASLLQFNEKVTGRKITEVQAFNGTKQHVVKVPRFVVRKDNNLLEEEGPRHCYGTIDYQSFNKSNVVPLLLKSLVAPDEDPRAAADVLCQLLAKKYNASFSRAMDTAQEVSKKNKKQAFFQCPENIVMYDGSARTDETAAKWNAMYQALLEFKKEKGHCLVPSPRNSDQTYRELGQWVSSMRTYAKTQAPLLTPKRIELLNSIGFVWSAITNQHDFMSDGRFWKTFAAKLCYNLSAHDAMRLSGYDPEFAGNDSHKKNVNCRVCDFRNGKASKHNDRLKEILVVLQDEGKTPEESFRLVYGDDNEYADQLRSEGKLDVYQFHYDYKAEDFASDQEKPPARKKRRIKQETDGDGGGSGGSGGKMPAAASRPALPFASRNGSEKLFEL